MIDHFQDPQLLARLCRYQAQFDVVRTDGYVLLINVQLVIHRYQFRSQVQAQSPNDRKSIEKERILIETGFQSRCQVQAQSPNERKPIENKTILIEKDSQSRSQVRTQSRNDRKPIENESILFEKGLQSRSQVQAQSPNERKSIEIKRIQWKGLTIQISGPGPEPKWK